MNSLSKYTLVLLLWLIAQFSFAQPNYSYKIARLKYEGGGNWYVSPTSLPNLINFCNQNLGTKINPDEAVVEPGSPDIFNFPFIHITGNGNILFSQQEADNLRKYLLAGGFLNINDSYGLDKFIRIQMKKVFPELDFIELPFNHPIYHQKYNFDKGVPKIHLHDDKAPQGFGLIYQGRLVCFYNYEADIGDGWEDPEVHHDPEESRMKALRMGANIMNYVLMGN
jgi:hypothetical protein